MKRAPTVFFVSAAHNGLPHTKKMLRCLQRQTYSNIQPIFIDDGSSDGTAEYIRSTLPKILLLEGNGNLWWTGEIYWGAREASARARQGDFVLTMNSDCTFGRDYVATLVKLSIRHDRAIVGAITIDRRKKSRIWDPGVRIDWEKGRAYSIGPTSIKQLPSGASIQSRIDTITTKGTLYPIEVFESVGNFEARRLPHYLSDYEFACRAKAAGFPLLLSYKARVYNDITRTGLGDVIPKRLSYRELRALLFSRKSRINIVDHWWFVRLACPPQYRWRNYGFILMKFLYLLSHVWPFFFFAPVAQRWRQRLFKGANV